ncbi:nucleotide exchange factor GrpE [Bifidobacterium psychraerophilum]|jgi:molecular chaperone GrpE|uniref:nucleotide exchange factor GrpE n=1 Tax=Bifidobacterium psychraerophilum TaxID=218140 RepID=UPI0039E831DD
MSDFDKDEYLRGMSDAESLAGSSDNDSAPSGERKPSQGADASSAKRKPSPKPSEDKEQTSDTSSESPVTGQSQQSGDASDESDQGQQEGLTALGKAKQEAAGYLEALQRERAEFINFRNRSVKEQDRFRQHGIIDVLTALLPALDDIDRIRQHDELGESFQAVSAKIDKTFEKFGVEKFGEAGEEFDPTKHEAILHKPDASAEKETVDTVVESGYRIGDRVIRAARVVVASPQGTPSQG